MSRWIGSDVQCSYSLAAWHPLVLSLAIGGTDSVSIFSFPGSKKICIHSLCCSLSWHLDSICLAIGLESGGIIFVSKDITLYHLNHPPQLYPCSKFPPQTLPVSLCWSQSMLLSCSNQVTFWRLENNRLRQIATLEANFNMPILKLLPDSSFVAISGCFVSNISLDSRISIVQMFTLPAGAPACVCSIFFMGNSASVLILSQNGLLTYLTVLDKRVVSSMNFKMNPGPRIENNCFWAAAWLSNGVVAVSNGSQIIRIVDFCGDGSLSLETLNQQKVSSMACDQQKNRIFAICDNGIICGWEFKSGVWVIMEVAQHDSCAEIQFHERFSAFVTLSDKRCQVFFEDKELEVCSKEYYMVKTSSNTATCISLRQKLKLSISFPFQIESIALCDSKAILYNSTHAQVWDLKSNNSFCLFEHKGAKIQINSNLFLVTSSKIICAEFDGTVILEDDHKNGIPLFLSCKGNTLAILTKSNNILFIDAENLVLKNETLIPNLGSICSFELNVSGEYLAFIESHTSTFFVYSLESKSLIHTEKVKGASRVLWDAEDSRVLGIKGDKTILFFVQDCVLPYTESECLNSQSIMVPYIYSLDSNQIYETLVEDFENLQVIDASFVKSMLDFRILLAQGNTEKACKIMPIKSKHIWNILCKSSVRSGNLESAIDFLGYSGNATCCRVMRVFQGTREEKLKLLGHYLDSKNPAPILGLQLQNKFDEAIKEANHPVFCKKLYYQKGRYLERLGLYDEAIKAYEESDSPVRVPKMLLGAPVHLNKYLESSKSPCHIQWRAHMKESQGLFEDCIPLYIKNKDYLSAVRVYCHLGKLNEANELAESSQNPAANYYLAQKYESNSKLNEAVAYYAKAGCFAHAIRLARQQNLIDDLMHLAIRSNKPDLQINVAAFYVSKKIYENAILLYLRADRVEEALELCFESQSYHLISQISAKLATIKCDSKLLIKCADLLQIHQQYQQCVELYVLAGEFEKAIKICTENGVKISEGLIETMPPQTAAGVCMSQGMYLMASKKYVQAGDKMSSLKALLKLGDLEQIIFFAGVTGPKNRDIFILAGNFLQTQNWRENPEILKHIISFYTKAKSFDNLSRFFEVCAQTEIDDYSDYAKAMVALKEAHKYATKGMLSGTILTTKVKVLEKYMELVEGFNKAKQAVEMNSMKDLVRECSRLLKDPQIDEFVRVGDIYGLLIEYYVDQNMEKEAESMYQQLLQVVPLKSVSCYLDSKVIAKIDPRFEQQEEIPEELQ